MEENNKVQYIKKYPLSLTQAAKFAGVSYSTLYNLWKAEKIEGAKILGVCRTNEEAVIKAINNTAHVIMPKNNE
jgi:lambda repressor-like predicted transcriptional regulator